MPLLLPYDPLLKKIPTFFFFQNLLLEEGIDSTTLILGAIGIFVLILLLLIFIKFCRKTLNCQDKNEDEIEIVEENCQENIEKYENILDKCLQEERQEYNLNAMDEMIIRLLTVVYHHEDDDEEIGLLSRYCYDEEYTTYHRGNEAEVEGSNYIIYIITETIIEDKFPGITRPFSPWIENLEKCLERRKFCLWLLHKLNTFFYLYFDIVKDIICIYIILSIFRSNNIFQKV